MIKVLQESNVGDNIYGLIKQLKDIEQILETFETLPADINEQIEIQSIRMKNAIGKINELIQNL